MYNSHGSCIGPFFKCVAFWVLHKDRSTAKIGYTKWEPIILTNKLSSHVCQSVCEDSHLCIYSIITDCVQGNWIVIRVWINLHSLINCTCFLFWNELLEVTGSECV